FLFERIARFASWSQALHPESVLLRDLAQDTGGGGFRTAGRTLQGDDLIAGRENRAQDFLPLGVVRKLRIAAEIGSFHNRRNYSRAGADSFHYLALQTNHLLRRIAGSRREVPIMMD